jgi:hypothetical protein
MTRAQARAVASRAGFTLVVAPGQSPGDADTVVKQFPLARSTVTTASLVLMAEFGVVAAAPTRPLWIIWAALGAALLIAGAATMLRKKAVAPEQIVPPPPITYAAGARPPSFSIDDRRSTRGLELSLAVRNDPGIQTVAATPSRAQ